METGVLIIAVSIFALAAVLIVVLVRGGALSGRLDQMAASQTAANQQLGERF